MAKEMTIESAFSRLDEIANELEKENLPLETSLLLYEEGAKLIAFASETLKNAKLRVIEYKNGAFAKEAPADGDETRE